MNRPTPAQRFDAIAATHDRHAALPREVGQRLLERLDGLNFTPRRIVDLGCATATGTLELASRFPQARLVALERSPGMLDRARRRRGRWRPRFELLRGDFGAPPLAEASCDLVHANLSLQWSTDLYATLSAIRRIMQPRGMLMLSLPGPDTLVELARAGVGLDAGLGIHAQELGDLLIRAGFQEPVLDTDWLTTTHSGLAGLLADCDHLGIRYRLPTATDALDAALRGRDEGISVTWEVLYATAWSPDEGQPVRGERGEEASVSVASLGIRKRRD